MPFKLKLKKTRQYNVASKTLFVISVELLDGGTADCTLSVDSTGQECLDNVCQRQSINQPEFFSLRYINNNQQYRWVELDRPLKRQLDKYASSHQLHLRVMYYVTSGTNLITDEVTRNHYFLQLKNDLIEGRIVCDYQQAVVLASYSRQAEYGNHDRERHTVDYLKNLLTFPKLIIDGAQIIDSGTLAETGRLEWLTSAVIQHHMALHNMSQAQAESGFISVCQLLRYYGQEMFSASEAAKQTPLAPAATLTIAVSLTGITLLTETEETRHFYRWQEITNVINHKRTFTIECQNQADSLTFLLPTPEEGKYVWRMCVTQHTFYMKYQQALNEQGSSDEPQPKFQEHGFSESREELDRVERSGSALEPLSAAHRAFSTSCLELEPQTAHAHSVRALLPSYRPAPDYETAVQQKFQQQRVEVQAARFQTHHNHQMNNKPLVYGSHPDIHRIHYPDVTRHTVSVNQGVAATDDYSYGLKFHGHNNYTPFAVNHNVHAEFNVPLRYINIYKPPPPYPSNGLASNSTPDLAVASQALNYHRGYINSHVSGSSPDLVSNRTALNRQYLGYVNGNVHNMVNYNRPVMPGMHGTYNNLASVLDVPNPHIIMDPHHQSDNIQKVHDERGNKMYSIPMHRMPYQRHVVMPQQQMSKLNNTNEPIYENIPLPWQNENASVRDRAHSLTTTDEISRLNDKNSSRPSINQSSDRNLNVQVPNYSHMPPSIKISDANSHYVNAQIIKDVRDSSVPKELNVSTKSINKDAELDNMALSVDRLSLTRSEDKHEHDNDTPYQSLSTHRVNNNLDKSTENITSINVPDIKSTNISVDHYNANISHSSGLDSGIINSSATTYNTTTESEASENTTKNTSKEKKRRRWGMFIGRSNKNVEVKSATLGRDRKNSANSAHLANKHRWSTGLPKQPLPPSITKETLCQLLERRMSDNQLSFAFEQIPKGRESGGEMTTALLPENAHINSYSSDYLPYEDNRVRLNPTPQNKCGYINASHITMTVGSSQRFYVVARVGGSTTAPRLTCNPPALQPSALLWECAWQVGARVVAVVGGEEHPSHLPRLNTTVQYGKFSVCCETRGVSEWGVTCGVKVTSTHPPARTLYHVQFTRWPQTGVPSVGHFLAFLSELGGLRLACGGAATAPVHSKNAPLVICCQQGAGRSGTTLAADLLLHTLDYNQELDIPRTVRLLHQQRANLIQNIHQYKFLHQILLEYLKQSRLI